MSTQQRQRKRYRLYKKQNGQCIYCSTKMWVFKVHKKGHLNKMATLEHIHPKGMGGTNKNDNIACSCYKCNIHRGQINHFKFMKIRKKKNWEQLAKEEKWRLQGIYFYKMRELKVKQVQVFLKHNALQLFSIILKCTNIIRKMRKSLDLWAFKLMPFVM